MKNLTKIHAGEQDVYVTAETVGKRYKVTSRAVLLWADRGLIPSLKIGTKTRRFEMSAVISALEGKGGTSRA